MGHPHNSLSAGQPSTPAVLAHKPGEATDNAASPLFQTCSGTVKDLASFFRVSERTVHAWKDEKPPRLPFWQASGRIVFGEEAVLDFWEAGFVASRRMKPGETRELARTQWRAHLAVRINLEKAA